LVFESVIDEGQFSAAPTVNSLQYLLHKRQGRF